jgi:uncharacterized RDD family membrane protein YckC
MTTTVQPQAQTQERANVAGFWIRVGAFLIDSIVIGLVAGVFTGGGAITNPDIRNAQHSGIETIASFLFFTILWSSVGGGQTLGMRLLGLRVVDREGKTVGYGTAVLRYVGFVISCAALLLGLVWVAFDPYKQGWHDKIAGTYVVRIS